MPSKPKLSKTQAEKEELKYREHFAKLKQNLPHLYAFPFYPWARTFFNSKNRFNFLCGANQLGKDLEISTEIPTPNGLKKMWELKVGDFVYGMNGLPTKVIAIPFDGEQDGYRLTFNDGSTVICGKNHNWICKNPSERFKKRGKGSQFYGKWWVRTTEQIRLMGGYSPEAKNTKCFSFPVANPIQPGKMLYGPAPYKIGYLIGNGSLKAKYSRVTINDRDIDIVDIFSDCKKSSYDKKSGSVELWLNLKLRNLVKKLRLNTNSPEKRIPELYFQTNQKTRKQLLAGLMDSDGTVVDGRASYSTTSPGLSADITRLVTSLGGITQVRRKKAGYRNNIGKYIRCLDCYEINVWTSFNPFWSKRKSSKWKPVKRSCHERILWKIEPVGRIRSRCITVDNSGGSFLCTNHHLVTHNSTLLIRKCIEWATNQKLWPQLWRSRPNVFWYLYPSLDLATIEVEKKWIPDLLPRNDFKDHPQYGWNIVYDKKQIQKIDFNSGVTVYFKAYTQNPQHLQAGTVFAAFCDEELLTDLFPEIKSRLSATNGYYHAGFTATLGQDFWRQVLEDTNPKTNPLPDALRLQISLYDCQYYEDGTPSIWTDAKIEEEKRLCPNDREVLRRIYGKFVKSEGLKYPSFDRIKNVKLETTEPPPDWPIYAGVDIGSGSPTSGHPSAIVFIAVRPDYRFARVYKAWVGKGIITTAADVLRIFQELRGPKRCAVQVYDYSARDFYTIACRNGETFAAADKSVEAGENMLNSLFKNGMLQIDDIPENVELIRELESLYIGEKKSKAVDDMVDALRYICIQVAWDWSVVGLDMTEAPKRVVKTEDELRREFVFGLDGEGNTLFEEEIDELNSLYEI